MNNDKQDLDGALDFADADIDAAMFSSLEGFASLVVGSIEFELGRDLTKEECQRVYRYTEAAITKGLSEPDKLPIVSFYRDGIEAAANWVDQQRESYDNEHGRRDNDTGSFEFGNDAQRDYSDTLAEIAEGIRALHPNAGIPPAPVMPDSENGLMPCPFCGGKARQLTIEQDNDPHFGGDVITCTECGASSHVEFGFKENLESAWNNRAAMFQLGNSPLSPGIYAEIALDTRTGHRENKDANHE
ncbi:restriction alleviation protein, Lar family [Citrobacter werkmanii]|uniref:Restriction alleviation protein, Lar family n=1 Tax=Citrobacter werkmanii TaxID=67827 RepID=A0A9N8CUT8_9ENTR|nr:Lar family restriction alleviation protein [Citrobacter werkmanii]CAB5549460.1 restriction alleviation protein, Lar family [Citrobacter werkmanii]CAB5577537.1 restriction alleviation protein, Lar family [Citrobacter werkmanii]CAB5591319.1 restriction alleviation protein, Lar family [Citrobacter werkmanii]CAB5591996.1 restriction alleviation protein, Lar family [Citrobacter werkmanii]CAB5592298.1 restriction alleviation protein, Lar family [Citrobacter werkmanii]